MGLILNYWEYIVGTVFVLLMLWWVTDGKSFLERRKEMRAKREAAERARLEAERQAVEHWIGWDGLHSK